MAKTMTAISVDREKSWKYIADDAGNILKLIISAEVTYDNGQRQRDPEDIWATLPSDKKAKIQNAYTQSSQWYDSKILG